MGKNVNYRGRKLNRIRHSNRFHRQVNLVKETVEQPENNFVAEKPSDSVELLDGLNVPLEPTGEKSKKKSSKPKVKKTEEPQVEGN